MLEVNNTYSQKDIKNLLDCTIMRGMNYKIDTNRLILIRNHIKSIYEDKQEGNILYYTGEGRIGNQELTGINLRLSKSKEANTEVLLFEVFKSSEYTYKGEVKLVGNPFVSIQNDQDGLSRNVYIFPLEIQNANALIDDMEVITEVSKQRLSKVQKLSNNEINEKAKQTEQSKPGFSYSKTKTYQRSEYIVEAALRYSNGICQLCNNAAPFLNKNNKPYLEVHHIKQLAKGGEDTISNTVALCPNCHRKMHSLNLEEDLEKLRLIASRQK